jgi:hypothetical protein
MAKLLPPAVDPAHVPEQSATGYPEPFKSRVAGASDAHQLVNESERPVLYLEIGDRTPEDSATYSDVDLAARLLDGKWIFTRKNGIPYK